MIPVAAKDRKPTQQDVAREAGVSRALVSIAYRGVKGISPEMRERIFEVADKIGYRPNGVAARLASRYYSTIGMFLLDLRNPIFADIYDGVRAVVSDEPNNSVVLSIGTSDGKSDEAGLDSLHLAQANVIIAAGLQIPDASVQRLNTRVPIVSTAREIPGVDSVFSDDYAGAQAAIAHLVNLGHERIAHIASLPRDGYMGRRRGYEAAMESRGLRPRVVEADYTQLAAAQAAGRLLDLEGDAPTAIFANNDVAAMGVMDALNARGLKMGRDVSVVGYDNTPVSALPAVSLTTVDLHAREIGVTAARLAVERIGDPIREARHFSSLPELVVRDSTRPPRRP